MIFSHQNRATTARVGALLAASAIVFGACTSAATPAPTAPPATAVPATPVPVTAAPITPAPATPTPAPTAAGAITEASEIAAGGVLADTSFCGTQQITLGISDGYGVNAWSQASFAAVESEAAKCPNVKVIALAEGGDVAKANSDVNSLVSQGINALVIIPDAGGPAQLPAIQAATAAGVKVVPWASDPSGVAGTDYVAYVDWNTVSAGVTWANWMVQALGGKGNVIFLGGPAGAAVGVQELAGIKTVFDANPGMKLLTGYTSYIVTNWDPATALAATTAALGQYPQIDGVIANYGTDADAAVQAFKNGNRPLVPVATLEEVGLSCNYPALWATNPKYQLETLSSRNWLGRIAARKAIAAAEGVPNTEPSQYDLTSVTDTLTGATPYCDPTLNTSDFSAQDSSNQLTTDQLTTYGKPTQ